MNKTHKLKHAMKPLDADDQYIVSKVFSEVGLKAP